MDTDEFIPRDLSLGGQSRHHAGVMVAVLVVTPQFTTQSKGLTDMATYFRSFSTGHSTTAAAGRGHLHTVNADGAALISLKGGLTAVNSGNATASIVLLKNGAQVGGTLTIGTNAQAAIAGFASVSLAVGDVLEYSVNVNAGSGSLGSGLWCQLAVSEAT
jgi:hypothetical protein